MVIGSGLPHLLPQPAVSQSSVLGPPLYTFSPLGIWTHSLNVQTRSTAMPNSFKSWEPFLASIGYIWSFSSHFYKNKMYFAQIISFKQLESTVLWTAYQAEKNQELRPKIAIIRFHLKFAFIVRFYLWSLYSWLWPCPEMAAVDSERAKPNKKIKAVENRIKK